MYVSCFSYKGGVAKTTTAIHIAGYLQQFAPTLLIDKDRNQTAIGWAERKDALPFRVMDETRALRHVKDFEHVVIDTQARMDEGEMQKYAAISDAIVIPTTPEMMAIGALIATADGLQRAGVENFRALLTIVPPHPSREGEKARALIRDGGVSVLSAVIPRWGVFTKASTTGVLVSGVDDDKAAEAWQAYSDAAKELTGIG